MIYRWRQSLLSLIAFCAIDITLGQSVYHLKSYNRFGNPGTLNTEFDNQIDASWKNILGDSQKQSYSASQPIDFSFKFCGNIVSTFKVASTGFLTFSTKSLPIPAKPEYNDYFKLPSSDLPDSTIYIGGITLAGSNDAVYSKVFGIAPNRQLWIKFNSFTPLNDSLFGRATVAIVLEETTNAIYFVEMTADGQSTPTNPFSLYHNFGIQTNSLIANSVGNQLGFTYSMNGTMQLGHSQNFNKYVDNHFYGFFPGNAPVNEIGVSPYRNLFSANYKVLQKSITGKFYVPTLVSNNCKLDTISYKLRYRFSDFTGNLLKDTVVNHSKIGFSDNYDARTQLNLDSFTIPNSLGKIIKVTITVNSVNGKTDEFGLNDTLQSNEYLVQLNNLNTKNRKMLLESFMGNWMHSSVERKAYQDSLKARFKDSVIVVNYHVADKMASVVDSLAQITAFNFGNQLTSWQSVDILNRGKNSIESNYDYSPYNYNQLNRTSKTNISVRNLVYDSLNKSISGTMKIEFLDFVQKSKLKVNALLMEEHVRGLGSGFNQAVPDYIIKDSAHYKKYGYFGFSNPIIGFEHNHVVWSASNGFWGKALNTSTDIYSPGDTVNWNFKVKIPKSPTKLDFQTAKIGDTSYNFAYGKPMDYYIVGLATEDDESPMEFTNPLVYKNQDKVGSWPVVLNADIKKVWDQKASTQSISNLKSIRVYPNPASDYIIAESVSKNSRPVSIQLFTISGTLVKSFEINDVNCLIDIRNFSSGLYLLNMEFQDGTHAAVKWMKP